jgi:hypothetical protein
MKHVGTIAVIIAATIAATILASAQGSSTEPQDKGNTGWTGGSRDQPTQQNGGGNGSAPAGQNSPDPAAQAAAQAAQAARDAESAKTQPVMAEGLDLNGPPRQFAARLTPE